MGGKYFYSHYIDEGTQGQSQVTCLKSTASQVASFSYDIFESKLLS